MGGARAVVVGSGAGEGSVEGGSYVVGEGTVASVVGVGGGAGGWGGGVGGGGGVWV